MVRQENIDYSANQVASTLYQRQQKQLHPIHPTAAHRCLPWTPFCRLGKVDYLASRVRVGVYASSKVEGMGTAFQQFQLMPGVSQVTLSGSLMRCSSTDHYEWTWQGFVLFNQQAFAKRESTGTNGRIGRWMDQQIP